MSVNIHGLSWFPTIPDKFVTWGQEISLYEICSRNEWDTAKSRLPNIPCNFLVAENRFQYARCVQPSYHKEHPIIAVGLGDGKVCVRNFHDTFDNSLEFTPRQQRMCLCLAWNEFNPNVLAIGHDRHRSDSCITIWDIERGVPKETVHFFGPAESAHSMCWDKSNGVLIAGMNQKQIKRFDLRQSNMSCQTIQTKTVHGLAVAPNGNYLSSFVDSAIMLWDLRAFERPVRHIQSAKNHLQVSWCPTRSSLLSSLQRESPYLTVYDIRSVEVDNRREVYHVKKQLLPFQTKNNTTNKGLTLTSLAWHPTDFERALVLSDAGNVLDFQLPICYLTAYSNHRKLPLLLQKQASAPTTPTQSNPRIDYLDENLLSQHIVDGTRERALCDYGLKTDFKNANLQLSPYLRNVWLTLNNLYADDRLAGLNTILGIESGHTSEALMASSRIESHVLQWPDFINNSNNLICFRSEQRDMAIKLCGWSKEQDLEKFVNDLCANKEYSRAAMICVFHLKILYACNFLSNAADHQPGDPSMYRIAAIALSSFNADRCSSTWRNQRSNTNMQIQDPHLRAIFSFLTTDNENFDAVLNEEGISLPDRVAFACKYLSESKLTDYVKQQILNAIEKGDLNGLLLTGESIDGINIIQSYIDASLDVQTAALISINYFSKEHFNNHRVQYWITSYLDWLNSWELWEKRAEIEIKIENSHPTTRSSRSVFLSCNFCGKSVSSALDSDARIRSASSNFNKLSSCPSCRKPLPRCSLCLLHMGTTLNTSNIGESGHESLGWQSKPFKKWFSWCQTCRHGGHTEHIIQWFKANSECPVSSCSCRCLDMDAVKPKSSRHQS